jgi:hypothetical protein
MCHKVDKCTIFDLTDKERQELAEWAELDSAAKTHPEIEAAAWMWDSLSGRIKDAHHWACRRMCTDLVLASRSFEVRPRVDLLGPHYELFPYLSILDLRISIERAAGLRQILVNV